MRRPPGRRSFRKGVMPYTLLAPAVAGLLLFSLYPFLSGIWLSFTSIGWVGDQASFAGLENYRTLFSGEVGAGKFFQDAALRSVFWTVSRRRGTVGDGLADGSGLERTISRPGPLSDRYPGADSRPNRHPGVDLAVDV